MSFTFMFKEATAFLEKEAVPFAQSSLKELAGYYLRCKPSVFSFFSFISFLLSATTIGIPSSKSCVVKNRLRERFVASTILIITSKY